MKKISTKTAHGFSMVEVLVTLLILSIGLLGLAGLQGRSLQMNNAAYESSLATTLSNDIINRMRANRAGVMARNYNQTKAGELSDEEPNCETTTGCDAQTMAEHDLAEWDASLTALRNGRGLVCVHERPNDAGALPNPDTPVCTAADANDVSYAIKIWWGPDDAPLSNSYVASYEP